MPPIPAAPPMVILAIAVLLADVVAQWVEGLLQDRARYVRSVAPLPSSRFGRWCSGRYLRFRLRRAGLGSLANPILSLADRLQRHRLTEVAWSTGHHCLHVLRPHVGSRRRRTTVAMLALAATGSAIGAIESVGRGSTRSHSAGRGQARRF